MVRDLNGCSPNLNSCRSLQHNNNYMLSLQHDYRNGLKVKQCHSWKTEAVTIFNLVKIWPQNIIIEVSNQFQLSFYCLPIK